MEGKIYLIGMDAFNVLKAMEDEAKCQEEYDLLKKLENKLVSSYKAFDDKFSYININIDCNKITFNKNKVVIRCDKN